MVVRHMALGCHRDHALEVIAQQAFPLLSCAVADERGTATTFKTI